MAINTTTTDEALKKRIAAKEAEIGTAYDAQQTSLAKNLQTARQNANNEALSRGMARSSYVQDRLSDLDSDAAAQSALIEQNRANALLKARSEIEDAYRQEQAAALKDEKAEFQKTIGAYYENFAQEINNVRDNGDSSDDWKIPYLQAARQQKLRDQEAEQAAAAAKATKTYTYTPKVADEPKAPSMSLSDAKKNAEAGNFSQGVLDALHNGGWTDADISAVYGYKPSAPTPAPAAQNTGYNSSYFNAAMSSMTTMLEQGKAQNAVQGIDSMWHKLSDEQRRKVQAKLAEYGYAYEGG